MTGTPAVCALRMAAIMSSLTVHFVIKHTGLRTPRVVSSLSRPMRWARVRGVGRASVQVSRASTARGW
ncbi:hypothetical protein [Streptomyces sp. DHE17-7]|uniref:hypothetical protein n=1 Tax=Streptomyces sp. DHE17-7 TaxID=2759949 RepID=UPI0022EB9179|nr:hypothetical protein [Streptomyces sp. DHE17-7]MBJ6622312.1 hypothetical protein [Streptomyces sp. DHE17-7]